MTTPPPTDATIPFNRPFLAGNEAAYVQASLTGLHLSGDGPFTKRAHALLRELTATRHALLTTSCTHALEMSGLLLHVGPGDEVIVPSYTFVSTANAYAVRGARVVFVDVRPDTLNLDERLLERAITPRTKAIVPVHYGGVACAMEPILELAARHRVSVVEDNAHGLFASYRGRPLGSFGVMATQSFHETKNITAGEAGALLLQDDALAARAEIIREKGTNRSRFLRGEVDKYTWVDLGSSYLPSDLLAALLVAQLEARDTIQQKRHAVWSTYAAALPTWADRVGVTLPTVPDGCAHPAHVFYLILPSLEARLALMAHLRARGVGAASHYQPLHLSDMGQRFGGAPGQCPVTERAADGLLRLPLHAGLTSNDLDRVLDAVTSFTP